MARLACGDLNLRRHLLHGDAAQSPHRAFIALLFLTATSGLALWAARGTAGLPLLLCLHLGAVMALFATLPYGKFAHGIFRTASLLRPRGGKAPAQPHWPGRRTDHNLYIPTQPTRRRPHETSEPF